MYKNIIFDTLIFNSILAVLHEENIQSIIIEGGKKTLETFIQENLWDEARVFIGNSFLENGTEAPKLKKNAFCQMNILEDQLLFFTNYD